MFQYEWFDKEAYEPVDLRAVGLRDVVKEYGVSAVRVSQWEEHCLECAPPDCYRECPIYLERMDKKCKRLTWGMTRVYLPEAKRDAIDIRFRKWSKLETQLYPGTLSPGAAYRKDLAGERLAKAVTGASRAVIRISPYMRLNGALVVFRRKYLKGYRKARIVPTRHFLLHVYSLEKEPFALILDVCLKNKELVHRERFEIQPGETIHLARLPEAAASPTGYGLLRLYPENDRNARLLIAFADCVALDESRIPAARAPKLKCVIWDLDNTLWSGTLIESEESALALRDTVLETIVELDRRGIVQSIASKNDFSPAMEALKRLGVDEYFLYPQIHWKPKSASLSAIAEALNIDVNSFGFIDDSAFERAEVGVALPQVRIYRETELETLLTSPEADVPITKESARRREMYQTEARRKEIAQDYGPSEEGHIGFLRECEMTLEIMKPETEASVARCLELIQRTNQLNLSGRKYTRAVFDQMLLNPLYDQYAMRCRDRFGDYGLAVYLQASLDDKRIVVSEFAMSCRIAQKTVENAILAWLARKYPDAAEVRFIGLSTQKNGLLTRTLREAGMIDHSADGQIDMRMNTDKPPAYADIVCVEEVIDR